MPSNIFAEGSGAVMQSLGESIGTIFAALPYLILAVIVLIIGVFVAVILGHAFRIVLDKLKVDDWVRKAHLTKAVGHTDVPALLGELLKWWIIIIFLEQAVALINLGTLSDKLGVFVAWLPSLLVAVIIFLLGLAGAHYIEIKLNQYTVLKGMRLAGRVLKWIIIIIVAIQALRLIGINVSFIESVFLLFIGIIAGGIALALGIGLGLGLKKPAEGFIKNLKKNL